MYPVLELRLSDDDYVRPLHILLGALIGRQDCADMLQYGEYLSEGHDDLPSVQNTILWLFMSFAIMCPNQRIRVVYLQFGKGRSSH